MARNPLQTNRDWLTQPLAPAWWPGQTSLQDQLARWQAVGQAQPAAYGQSLSSATPLQNEIAPGTMATTRQMQGDPMSRYVDPWTGQFTADGQQHARNAIDMAMAMGGVGPSGGGFRAFHGSPHSFDAFDASKIGTGEGAQAYGHGMYLADAEGTARSYRDKLAGPTNPTTLQADIHAAIDAADVHPEVANIARNSVGDPNLPAVLRAMAADVDPQYADQFHKLAEDVGAVMKPPGFMYEVEVNADPEHFLDWDKPLSAQSQHVRDALAQSPYSPPDPHMTVREYISQLETNREYASKTGDPAALASAALKDAGIPGIRYLDQGSRGAGNGTRNTVVFSPEIMNIIRKYGIAGLMAGGAGAASVQNQTPSGGASRDD